MASLYLVRKQKYICLECWRRRDHLITHANSENTTVVLCGWVGRTDESRFLLTEEEHTPVLSRPGPFPVPPGANTFVSLINHNPYVCVCAGVKVHTLLFYNKTDTVVQVDSCRKMRYPQKSDNPSN